MARMVGIINNDPHRLGCALHALRQELEGDGDGPMDGWGVGYYDHGRALLIKRPTSAEGLTYYDLASHLSSNVLLAHRRRATVGESLPENTHPFRYRQWLFAHQGTLAGGAAMREEVLRGLPDFLAREVRGKTDSELIFYHFLAGLHRAGMLDDPYLDVEAVGEVLGATVHALAERDRAIAPDGGTTLNVMASNGRLLVATACGAPLYYALREGLPACGVCDLSPEINNHHAIVESHRRLRMVVVASGSVAPAESWCPVPDGSLVTVDWPLVMKMGSLGDL